MDLFCVPPRLCVYGPSIFALSLVLQLVSRFSVLRAEFRCADADPDSLASLPFAYRTLIGRSLSV